VCASSTCPAEGETSLICLRHLILGREACAWAGCPGVLPQYAAARAQLLGVLLRRPSSPRSTFRGPLFRAVETFTPVELDAALSCALSRTIGAARDLDAGVGLFELQRAATDFLEGLDLDSLGFFIASVSSVAAEELRGLGGVIVELAKMPGRVAEHRTVERCPDCDSWGRPGQKPCRCDEDANAAAASGVCRD